MNRYFRLIVVAASLALSCGGTASAQSQQGEPEKPFRGLFGGNEADLRSRQALDFRFSLYGAWEENVTTLLDSAEYTPSRFESLLNMTGYYAGATSSLSYSRRGKRFSFNAVGGAHFRYYTEQQEFSNASDWASVGFSASLSPKTTLSASQGVSYSPYYSNGFFPMLTAPVPGEVLSPSPDYYTFYHPNYSYTTAVNLGRRLTPRSSLSAYYNLNYVDFTEQDDLSSWQPFRNQMAGARYQHNLTKTLGFHAGYAYTEGRYGWYAAQAYPVKGHNIDVGLDYSQTLPLGRKTTFGFATGTSIVEGTSNYADEKGENGRYYFNALVTAYVNTAIGRTWKAGVNYGRGLMFVQGFQEPWFYDSVWATLGGYLGRRVNVSFQGGWTNGGSYYALEGAGIDAWTALANLHVALTRTVAVFGQYFYYHYDVAGQQLLPFVAARDFERHGVRAGLTVWLPLLR